MNSISRYQGSTICFSSLKNWVIFMSKPISKLWFIRFFLSSSLNQRFYLNIIQDVSNDVWTQTNPWLYSKWGPPVIITRWLPDDASESEEGSRQRWLRHIKTTWSDTTTQHHQTIYFVWRCFDWENPQWQRWHTFF